MKGTLNVLIGAGFSYYAGLPLGNDVKAKFNRDLRTQLLRASGSEWFWKEGKDATTVHNGSIGVDSLSYSYILNEVVNAYKKEKGEFEDYEDFYQYVKDKSDNLEWYTPLFDRAKRKMYFEYNISEPNEYYDIVFQSPQISLIEDIVNYLIADMLWCQKNDDELKASYSYFINYISQFEEVNIFTLNHDILLERLFNMYGLSYSDGFTRENSSLYYEEIPLPTFQCKFDITPIKIIKLHGSIHNYLFQHGLETNSVLIRNGEYTYFKSFNYQSKHYVVRKDLRTGNIVQRFSPSTVIPRFITGKNKRTFIQSDYMYSELFKMYTEKIHSVEKLLVVGYSYRDEHINEELKKFTKTEGPEVINLNRKESFPFFAPAISEIKRFDELK